jgi:hypothetical protein
MLRRSLAGDPIGDLGSSEVVGTWTALYRENFRRKRDPLLHGGQRSNVGPLPGPTRWAVLDQGRLD